MKTAQITAIGGLLIVGVVVGVQLYRRVAVSEVNLPGFGPIKFDQSKPSKTPETPSKSVAQDKMRSPAPQILGRWKGTVTLLGTTAVQTLSMNIWPGGSGGTALVVDLLSKGDSEFSPTWKVTYGQSTLVFLQGNENKCENRVELRLNRRGWLTGTSSPADHTQEIDPGCALKTYNQPDNYYYSFQKQP